jgi:hypothetical protein
MDSNQNLLTIATFVLAFLTGLLALATVGMAMATRKVAKTTLETAQATSASALAAEYQTRLARDALEAGVRPILTDVPAGTPSPFPEVSFDNGPKETAGDASMVVVPGEMDAFAYCSIPLRNVGPGVAFVTSLGLRFGEVGWSGKASSTVVAARESTRFTFSIPKDRPELEQGLADLRAGRIVLEVRYTDVRGAQDTITRAVAVRRPGESFRVRQVFLFRAGEQEPFVSSGPADP